VSEERYDLVRRMLDAISRRDTEAIVAEVHPEFEFMPLITVWPQPYLGHAGIQTWMRDVEGLWEEFAIEATAFRDLEGDDVLASLSWTGRGKGAGALLEGFAAAVIRFRDGRPVSASLYPDEARALASYSS
jgi:ketosteroid isomerase-like protein